MFTRPPVVEWLTDIGVAKRMGITVAAVHALIADGTFHGELRRLSVPGGGSYYRREFVYWIRVAQVEAEMERRSALAVDATASDDTEWDMHGYKLAAPEPCVLYGLLTADDVRELERRRAMIESRRTDVIPMEAIHRELAAVG